MNFLEITWEDFQMARKKVADVFVEVLAKAGVRQTYVVSGD